MIAQLFYIYGGFCATHPWEIIMAVLTVTTCLLSMEKQHPLPKSNYMVEHNADFALTMLIQCIAVIYSCFQFSKLLKMGKYYVLAIASLLTVLSSFLLTSTIINFMYADLSSLKNTLLCFLLVTHLSKAGKLAKFVFVSHKDVKENIGTGMARIGPTMTLDTLVEALVIGMGTLSGVNHLEVISYGLLLSVVVNYAVFMTFYPASVALIMNFHRTDYTCGKTIVSEEEEKINPVVQRVKLIMSIELIIIHFHSRWFYQQDKIHLVNLNKIESALLYQNISKWLTLSTAHIMVLTIFLVLVAKFVFFENEEDNQQPIGQQTDNLIQEEDTIIYQNQETQTECKDNPVSEETPRQLRDLDECLEIYNSNLDASKLSNEEVQLLVKHKYISMYQIEKAVGDLERGVKIRRNIIGSLNNLPFKNYDYSKIMGACCENVIGYVPIPVGIVGPLHLDGRLIHVPLATTEGCLVASTNRGSRALLKCGVTSKVVGDGMTRGPVVRFPSVTEASAAKSWIEKPENFDIIKNSFDAGSRFARLTSVTVRIVGRLLYIRFVAKTGDAMGMNMVSKGTELSLKMMQSRFLNMEILSLSGNTCTDKKPAAINWIEGRGKSVVCEAIVPGDVVSSVLKTTVGALVELNTVKNLIGSAVAGSIGGFNAHAANLVTAIFIATGQDPAQNVCSSNCMTLMEHWGERGEDLYVTCTMPSIEVGTVGGGTGLLAQSACLDILGVKGSHQVSPGENANQLARIVCGTVLAGELSLIAALTSGHLVKSHLKHNRSLIAISDGTNLFSQHR